MLDTPILLLVFNRPEPTKKVFAAIRAMQPKYLFIAADGARSDKKGEDKLCEEVRELVTTIDWECELKLLFRNENLGCGKSVFEAINWFFEYVEEGIILEDDCVPHPHFFNFCTELLDKYRLHENLFVIGGNNFLKNKSSKESYYFSAYGHIWGWATWKRAWKKYDFTLKSFNDSTFKECLSAYFSRPAEVNFWNERYLKMKYSPIDTWDYQWTFSQWYHKGISVTPSVNLVKNIGFGKDATHTHSMNNQLANLQTESLKTIIHPKSFEINKSADRYIFDHLYLFDVPLYAKLKNKLSRYLKNKLTLKG